ncbi:Na+/H+ antiporter subunit E [Martelella radicis]|uniref:Multicomponent Na+:H+ antiporter subunit E n=1 Tax=Martelella radicis TaxID=1397476 RepID=A0A7W6KKJ8_9HYPH|nr:Na+/H+ antiporter subunit E [Martelella radicis]MBB4121565.1 multicomponent Na+:H+ antiporter subunit E [Martelella radicis]
MSMLLLNLVLAIVWVAVTGSASLHNLVFGFVIGAIAVGLVRHQVGGTGYFSRARRVTALFLVFLYDLMKSAWSVAKLVCSPRMDLKPGILRFELSLERDFEIVLLANMITLTPGTLTVDVSDDKKYLFIHAIDCSDPDGIRRDIANGFEKKIREAFA